MQFKEMWKAQDRGNNGLFQPQTKCIFSSPEPETDCFEVTLGIWGCWPECSWDSSSAAVVCLGTTIVVSHNFRKQHVFGEAGWCCSCCDVPSVLMSALWMQWELRALSTLLAAIITSWLGLWTIKAFRYSHTELMRSCKHEVLILTTVKCYCWNINFHFEYLSICVLFYWYAHTVWGLQFEIFGQQDLLGPFLLLLCPPALMPNCKGLFMYNK